MSAVHVSAEALTVLAKRVLSARGVGEEDASDVAECLVETSLRGVDTHGIRLLPVYARELEGGRSRARPSLTWRPAGAALHVLDAGGALGIVAGRAAAARAIDLARSNGIGAVSVASSNHFGAASLYTLQMAAAGCIGICASNSDALVAPYSGKTRVFGTNPISFAVQGEGQDLFCVDMATSQASWSMVRATLDAGATLPRGWAIDAAGSDLATSEARGEPAALLSLDGHKGQCLSMMVELLCCLVSGAPFDHELSHLYAPPYDAPRRIGHFVLALDLASFGEPAAIARRVSELMQLVREAPAVSRPVVCPGDLELAARARRLAEGIPLGDAELVELRSLNALLPGGTRIEL